MEEEQRNKRRLTQKQETFTQNLFKGMTQREAWIQAGYSSNYALSLVDSHACRLANRDKIKARYAELTQKAEDESIATVKERKQILTEITRGNLTDYQETGADGAWLNIGKESPHTKAIAEITSRTNEDNSVITKVKLHNPIQAITELNKMEKVYAEGVVNVDNRTVNINVGSDKAKELTERLVEGERTE